MAEGLREIAQSLAGSDIDLLSQQTHVVGVPAQALEELVSGRYVASQGQVVDEPEAADDKRPFVTRQPIRASVAVDQSVLSELRDYSIDGGTHPRICRRQESDERYQQAGSVQVSGVQALCESAGTRIDRPFLNRPSNSITCA